MALMIFLSKSIFPTWNKLFLPTLIHFGGAVCFTTHFFLLFAEKEKKVEEKKHEVMFKKAFLWKSAGGE